MKIIQVNATYGIGSTGNIVRNIHELMNLNNIDNFSFYSLKTSDPFESIMFGNYFLRKINALYCKLFGCFGFEDFFCTKKLIRKIKEIKPDIVHLHNIHSHDINLKILFRYLNKHNVKVLWTFHDCWAFTGYCFHFENIGCSKWQSKCYKCPLKKHHSFFFDLSKKNFLKKKKLLSEANLTIVTCSNWLNNLVNQSFLSDKAIKTIYNGIDLSVFNSKAKRLNICNKKIVLFVAYNFTIEKGIMDAASISRELDYDEFQCVVVGNVDEKFKLFFKNTIFISNTSKTEELASIYASAYVYVNTTYMDTLPSTNLEAIACGTPVITYDVCGAKETISNDTGFAVNKGEWKKIIELINSKKINEIDRKNCLKRSFYFEKNKTFMEYIDLYKSIVEK